MKQVFLCLSVFILLLSSCSKDDKSRLLTTIPSDTSFVALINLEKLNEDLGNKVSGSDKIETGKQFDEFLDSDMAGNQFFWRQFKSNELSIKYGYAAIFENNGSNLLTFYVEDSRKFIETLSEADPDTEFGQEAGVWIDNSKTTAVFENQVWMRLSAGEPLQSARILTLARLKDKKSFSSVEYASEMCDKNDDVQLYFNIPALGEIQGVNGMGLNMLFATLFDDAKYLAGSANFKDGLATARLQVLNKDFKTASLALKFNEIDIEKLNSFNGKGSAFFALNLDPASVSKIVSEYAAMLRSSFMLDQSVLESLRNLDGTIVAAADLNGSVDGTPFSALISFDNAANSESATEFFRQFGGEFDVSTSGNLLLLSYGEPAGMPVSSVSSLFKGTCGGFVISLTGEGNDLTQGISSYFKQYSSLAKKDGAGLELEINIKSKPGQNFLLSLVEYLMKQGKWHNL